MKAHRSI